MHHQNAALVTLLDEVAGLVAASEPSLWSGRTPSEVAEALALASAQLSAGRGVDFLALRVLFAPTGSIQEIAIENRWAERYLRLSARFDALIATVDDRPPN